jgi:hypothetical protein
MNIAGFGLARRGANTLHVRTRVRLGHRDGADCFASDDLAHPARFLRLGPGMEHVHRSHVGVNQCRDRDA